MKLDGKTAIVTGGASGIGRATVLEFARAGATVFSGDIDTDGGARVAGEAGANASFLALDVADPGAIETFAAAVLERAPTVDVVVNVAGWDRIEPFMDNEPEFWDRVVAINRTMPSEAARGEYIGVARFTPAGAEMLRAAFHRVRATDSGGRFQAARTFQKAYLIDLFQEMIEEGTAMHLTETAGGYMEIDTNQDFQIAREEWAP